MCNVFFKYAQIASAAAMSFMHGAQDGQKFIGVLFLGVAFANGQTSVGDARHPHLDYAAVLGHHGYRHQRGR